MQQNNNPSNARIMYKSLDFSQINIANQEERIRLHCFIIDNIKNFTRETKIELMDFYEKNNFVGAIGSLYYRQSDSGQGFIYMLGRNADHQLQMVNLINGQIWKNHCYLSSFPFVTKKEFKSIIGNMGISSFQHYEKMFVGRQS